VLIPLLIICAVLTQVFLGMMIWHGNSQHAWAGGANLRFTGLAFFGSFVSGLYCRSGFLVGSIVGFCSIYDLAVYQAIFS